MLWSLLLIQYQCNETYAGNDVIPILPIVPTDIARLSLRLKTLKERGLTHALKKAPGNKKRKKNADKEANGETTTEEAATKSKDSSASDDAKKENKKDKTKPIATTASNGIKNATTASLTKRVLEEQEERNKRRKLEQNDNVKSLFSKGNAKPSATNSADYMTRGFSIGAKK